MNIHEKILELFHRTHSVPDLIVYRPITFFDFYDFMKNMKSDIDYYSQHDHEVKNLYKEVMIYLRKIYKKIIRKKNFMYVPDFDLQNFVNSFLNYLELKKRTYESTQIPSHSHNSHS